MSSHLSRVVVAALLGVMAASLAACSKDPDQAKAEYLASGDRLAAEGKHREAIVEYRNAIQQDARFGEARLKLADAYLAVSEPANAFREYVRAADLMPDDLDVQVKAGTFLLLAGQFEDARARAEKVLARDAKHVQAQILRANALAGLKDLDGAVRDIEQAIHLDPALATTYSNLGALQLARGDREEAEKAFRQAVATDPKSVPAHLALANFLWSTGQIADAETSMRTAVDLEPANLLANRALATFYLSTGKVAEAEVYLKRVADDTKQGGARLALADYYISANRAADALRVLEPLAAEREFAVPARSRIAAIQYAQGDRPEGHRTADALLAEFPTNPQALVVKARMLLADGKADEAKGRLDQAVQADAQTVDAHFLLGTIYAARNDYTEAVREFNEVLRLNPRAVAAQVQLARIELRRGSLAASVQAAEQAAKNAPDSPVVRLVLARALIARGDLDKAGAEMKTLLDAYPDSAVVVAQMGLLQLARNDRAAARTSFERARQIEPNLLDALTGLTAVDLAEGNAAAAVTRVDEQRARTPDDVGVLLVAARTYATTRDPVKAEQALRRAIELDPNNLQAYGMLGQLFLSQQKLDDAVSEFEALARKQPKSVAAHTMVAMIWQTQGRDAEAQKRYEQILQIDPRAAVAANNLAWMYAEQGRNLDQALTYAQIAKEQLPQLPEVDDTLGWVYYKRDLASMAVPAFEEALERDPNNPLYHYRLGLALVKTGDWERAKRSLQQALKLKPDFPGAHEARQALASLGG
jgi:putative PEP-CTERM system TPR-repeat lipoprotein